MPHRPGDHLVSIYVRVGLVVEQVLPLIGLIDGIAAAALVHHVSLHRHFSAITIIIVKCVLVGTGFHIYKFVFAIKLLLTG